MDEYNKYTWTLTIHASFQFEHLGIVFAQPVSDLPYAFSCSRQVL